MLQIKFYKINNYLSDVSSSADTDSDVDISETLLSEDEHGLLELDAEDLRGHVLEGTAVDLDESASLLAEGDGGGRLLTSVSLDRLDEFLSHLQPCKGG